MKQQLETIRQLALKAIEEAEDQQGLENLRVKYLGKKGELTAILKQMGKLSPEERPIMGQLANDVRAAIEETFTKKAAHLKEALLEQRLKRETIDVTLPGKHKELGSKHPLSIVLDEIKEIFVGMGFDIVEGPEVESDYYNFEALNIPKNHPARDTQDTFYCVHKLPLYKFVLWKIVNLLSVSFHPVVYIVPMQWTLLTLLYSIK